MKPYFICDYVEIQHRDTYVGLCDSLPKYERLVLKVVLKSSGDTRKIKSKKIVNTILKQLSKLPD